MGGGVRVRVGVGCTRRFMTIDEPVVVEGVDADAGDGLVVREAREHGRAGHRLVRAQVVHAQPTEARPYEQARGRASDPRDRRGGLRVTELGDGLLDRGHRAHRGQVEGDTRGEVGAAPSPAGCATHRGCQPATVGGGSAA